MINVVGQMHLLGKGYEEVGNHFPLSFGKGFTLGQSVDCIECGLEQ